MARLHATNSRGAALAAVAISLGALLSITVVGVDVGRLAHTAGEVQTVAQVAAAAGVMSLLTGATAATARQQAQAVVAQNRVAGAPATIADANLDLGQYDLQAGTLSSGAVPPSAVRAQASATVRNLVAGYFGGSFLNATLTRTATATFVGLARGAATLPLAIGDCDFPALSTCFGNPSCLPQLTQAPNTTNNTGWTSFFQPNPSNSTVGVYFPAACGGSVAPPIVQLGDSINLNNGQVDPLLKSLKDCLTANITQFLIPVVSCAGNFNGSSTVTGFATIVIDSVVTSGGSKGVNAHIIFKPMPGTPGGCSKCGTGHPILVG
jgi:hypothetical protein